jgi:hypothetical protein
MWLTLWLVLQQTPLETRAHCEGFDVVVTSPSGDPLNDDGVVEVEVARQRLRLPFAPAMFSLVTALPGTKSRCGAGPVAWEVEPGLVVLLLSRSGRPGLDRVSLALVDVKGREVLGALEPPLEYASGRTQGPRGVSFHFQLRAAKHGFDVWLVRSWLPGDDTPTGALEDWWGVRVERRKLTGQWLRPSNHPDGTP